MTPEQLAAMDHRLLALELALDRIHELCPPSRNPQSRKWRDRPARVTLKGAVVCRTDTGASRSTRPRVQKKGPAFAGP
jgi:hypothetical protein